MKKIALLVFILICFVLSTAVFAVDKNVTAKWVDDNSSGAVASWDIFTGTTATGPWTLVKNQAFYDKGAATEYTSSFTISVADNAQTTIWVKAQTIGTNGLKSVDSNVVSKVFDTRVAPSAPKNFTVE